jgi:hypothetical protein
MTRCLSLLADYSTPLLLQEAMLAQWRRQSRTGKRQARAPSLCCVVPDCPCCAAVVPSVGPVWPVKFAASAFGLQAPHLQSSSRPSQQLWGWVRGGREQDEQRNRRWQSAATREQSERGGQRGKNVPYGQCNICDGLQAH